MEAIAIKRLEAMGNKVREGMGLCQELIESLEDQSYELDKTHKLQVEKLRMSVNRLKKEIRSCMVSHKTATPEFEDTIETLTTLQIEAEDLLVEIDTQFSSRQQDNTQIHYSTPVNETMNTRLPKLDMKKYDGNILRWHEFWDQFSSAIENRQQMSDVDKLSYLSSLVEGDAKRAIEGLDITNANYKIAVNRLTERFGKKGSLIDAHYTALQQIPKATSSINSCRRTLDEIERHLRTLHSLGEDTEHKQLRATILEKFPDETMFDLRMAMTSDDHTVSEIRSLLEKVICARETAHRMASINNVNQTDTRSPDSSYTIEALYTSINDLKRKFAHASTTNQQRLPGFRSHERGESSKSAFERKESLGNKRKYPFQTYSSPKGHASTPNSNVKQKKLQCIFCSGPHIHERCDKFKTIAERKKKLGNRCFLCLRDTHSSSNCPTKEVKCYHCQKRGLHNRCLCPQLNTKVIKHGDKTRTNTLFSFLQCDTVLQTASARIGSMKDKFTNVRLLLDTGSQKSYIRAEVAKGLKLRVVESTDLTIFTFGSPKPMAIATTIVSFIMDTPEKPVEIRAFTIPTLTGTIPSHPKLRSTLKVLYPSLHIAEDATQDSTADVIIGNDYYHSIIQGGRIQVSPTLILLESAMGWIPSGTYEEKELQHNTLSVLTYFKDSPLDLGKRFYSYPDPALRDDNIKDIWELETIGIKDTPKAIADEEVIQFFEETTIFENGRYYVKWPWTQYPPDLPINFGLAWGRLKSLIRKTDSNTLSTYNDVIQDQLNKGVVEIVTESRLPDTHPVHYLPHHGVLQPQKTTKLRIVYDGSAKTKGQLSLNEYLYKGPLLLEDLTALLLKFRQYPIGITADIEKAFLQIGLQIPDRDVTRFLWVKDTQEGPVGDNLIHLRFCRVPFGIISSPFLLAATIRRHLLHSKDLMAKKVADCLYVDNLVTGVDTLEEAKTLFHQTRKHFSALSMNIREWTSDSRLFMDFLPEDSKIDVTSVRVLGLKWDTSNDILSIAILPKTMENQEFTKRQILKIIASIYDPCGFVAPLTLPARLLLQDMWKEKIKWDTPLPEGFGGRWERCKTFLKIVPKISLPRCYYPKQTFDPHSCTYELHCFTDASKDAYVAVVYLRVSSQGRHWASLMISRSRLTPLKRKESLTIPKLELLAVVIGTRLLQFVRVSTKLPINKSFLWTDSQVVLGWLRSDRLLPPFVARRVAEVKTAEITHFRYIQSTLNPADIATRPITGNTLPTLWTKGPDFLGTSSLNWPACDNLHFDMEKTNDKCRTSGNVINETCQFVNVDKLDYTLPSTGIVIPTPQIIAIQTQHYPDEQRGKLTPLARSLGLYRDEVGVLRCKGRFANAEFSTDQKYPILLPKLALITSQIIRRIHDTHHHVGVHHTLSLLRQTYWVPQGRSLVTKVLHRCDTCVKYGGGPYQLPGMPALPPERVTFSAPFTNIGLDYFGPLTTVQGGLKQKRWGCLFTCMAVRAVHIEMVDDCTAEEFLLAFRRFAATRGVPKLVVSDNATHFKLAALAMETSVDKGLSTRWKFIPALSPWFGGFYERLIGLIKNCLRRTLDQSLLNDGQLRTVLHEIAATLNTRPLTAVSSSHEMILTPSHFLSAYGPSIIHLDQSPTAKDASRVRKHLLGGWKRTDALLRQFGVMFQTHYLTSLRERHTLAHKQPRILSPRVPKVGDRVQLKGDSKNRVHWKVGTVTSILASSDGAVRTARVTLPDKTVLNRSIGHLYPLEMDIADHSTAPQADDLAPNLSDHHAASEVTPDTAHTPTLDDPPLQQQSTLSDSHHRPSVASENRPPQRDETRSVRPTRAAAKRALDNIRSWTRTMFTVACSTIVHS